MPGRNIIKLYSINAYYHAYNRGVNKRVIFKEETDYLFFESLLARHLSLEPVKDSKGREYSHMREGLSLLAYCLMPNHFHLMLFQKDQERILPELMRSVGTAYTVYFNKKYRRRGPLFENHYRAVLIHSDNYLQHISRYIHLNPKNFKTWPYSSYKAYTDQTTEPDWLETQEVLGLFESKQQYLDFVADYEEAQRILESIKRDLADY